MRRSGITAALTIGLILLLALVLAGPSAADPVAGAPGCPVFPADNPWNQRVEGLPAAADSATLVRSIGLGAPAHPDFGSGLYEGAPIGIPYTVVGPSQRLVPVSFEYASESDRGLYPIPPAAPIEGGARSDGDRHVIVIDRANCRDYELFDAFPRHGGRSWRAASGAIFDLGSDRLRTRGYTSADAAGLPILPGLVRYSEVAHGEIDHAIRFTAPRTRRAFVYPARHYASSSKDPRLPPMGTRIRLKANLSLAGLGPQARVVARALQRYGALLADNGSPWYFSGAPDAHWNNEDLHTLSRFTGSDFEVVNTSSLSHPG